MHYAIVNDENRVKKAFTYDTSTYTLVLDTHFNTSRQCWKWEDNYGEPDVEDPMYFYDYIISVESDNPVNIFEKHVIAFANLLTFARNEYTLAAGLVFPVLYMPAGDMSSSGGATRFYTDMMVSHFAGVGNAAVDPNLLAFYTDESFYASTMCHYDPDYFDPVTPDPFGSELTAYFTTWPNGPWVFSLPNRFTGDDYEAKFYGAGMTLLVSTYKEDTNVRVKIYRKVVSTMTPYEEEPK